MRKTVLNVLGVLVVAALTVQTATAAPRSGGKAVRAPARASQQFRDAFDSAPKAVGNKSCDRFWCYPD
jgi:hypothetical protein